MGENRVKKSEQSPYDQAIKTRSWAMRIRDREIADSDLKDVSEFLGKGIGYSSQYFLQLLRRLAQHPTPSGFPKYGRLLTCDSTIVGTIILIFSTVQSDGIPSIRCQITGWCVEPAYRSYAAIFFAKDLKHKNVTYLNLSAQSTVGTLPIIEAQGFMRYSSGQFVAVPALQFASDDTPVKIVTVDEVPNAPFHPYEQALLLAHAEYGCISLWCVTSERAYPFVFRPRLFKRIVLGVQLIYCRDIEDFGWFAAPIGRFLALRGRLVVRIDSNGPIRGLVGKFLKGADPRFYKGAKPRIGDLAYTALAMSAYVPRKKSAAATRPGTAQRAASGVPSAAPSG
jgi:hypothetical protein